MLNVLIVEDDLSIAMLLEDELETCGYNVIGVARTVNEAKLLIGRLLPDYAVVDLHLSEGGLGTDVAAYLRTVSNAVIVFSTGNDDACLTLREGDAVMVKPYRMRDVTRGFKILGELAQAGRTQLTYPRNFRVLHAAAA